MSVSLPGLEPERSKILRHFTTSPPSAICARVRFALSPAVLRRSAEMTHICSRGLTRHAQEPGSGIRRMATSARSLLHDLGNDGAWDSRKLAFRS